MYMYMYMYEYVYAYVNVYVYVSVCIRVGVCVCVYSRHPISGIAYSYSHGDSSSATRPEARESRPDDPGCKPLASES